MVMNRPYSPRLDHRNETSDDHQNAKDNGKTCSALQNCFSHSSSCVNVAQARALPALQPNSSSGTR